MTFQEMIQEVDTLTIEERKQLIMHIIDSLVVEVPQRKHNILEFEGLGAHLYNGTDAQEYVNELRREWDHRP